jgi:hypothetical protein
MTPIRAECLRDNREQAGVIAGLTLEERAKKPPAQKRTSCGTSYGASAHYKRGESVCEACRIAGNASRTKARQARRAAERAAA